ncbi:MAG: DUF3072 domain-containing protein [Myxococcales bacterium]|nr:MAG: DUF3072 domain-containing protein [Myxococcales bacterium]
MAEANAQELQSTYHGAATFGPHAPMTLSQASYLMTLCEETNEVLDDSLSQAEAAELIYQLELATGRAEQSLPWREQ